MRAAKKTPRSLARRGRLLLGLAICIGAISIAGCSGNTTGATNVTPTSATLNATGKCDNRCNVQFRYRVAEGRWTYTPSKPYPSSGGQAVHISQQVDNLSPGMTYNYQVCGDDQGKQGEACVGPGGSTTDPTSFTTPGSSAPRIRLMTYNVADYSADYSGAARNRIKDEIEASGADVVALQETTQLRGQALSEADRIAADLGWGPVGEHSFYRGWSDPEHNCTPTSKTCISAGNAIISRYKFANSPTAGDLYHESPGTKRNLLQATIQVGSKQLLVYATHLARTGVAPSDNYPYYDNYSIQQLGGVMLEINGKAPASQRVLMGDFNLPYDAPHVKRGIFDSLGGYHDWKVDRIPADHSKLPPTDLGAPVGNVCTSKAPPPSNAPYAPCTYPASGPTEKLDDIWVRGYPLAAGYVHCPTSGCNSDHRPYFTDIIF
jgi:Metal-dependent hydrolase